MIKPLATFLAVLAAAGPLAALEVARRSGEYPLPEGAPVKLEVDAGQLRFDGYGGEGVAVEMVLTCTGDLYKCQEAADDVALASSVGDGEPVVWLGGPEEYRRGREATDRLLIEEPRQAPVFRTGAGSSRRSRTAAIEEPRQAPVFRTCSASRVRTVRGRSHTITWDLRPNLKAPGWRLDVDLGIRYPTDRRLEVRLGEGKAVVNGLRSDATVRVEQGDAQVSLNQSDVGSLSLLSRKGSIRLQRRDGRAVRGKRWRLRGSKLAWEGDGRLEVEVEVGEGDVLVQLY